MVCCVGGQTKPRRNLLFLLLIPLSLAVSACNPTFPLLTQSTTPLITQDEAITLASGQIPTTVLDRAGVTNEGFNEAGGYWLIVFEIPSTVTREELGWLAVPGTELFYPASSPGNFRVLYVRVDANTGEILLRQATENGLPQITFVGVPEERMSWMWAPVIGVAIFVFGLFALWLIIRKRGLTDGSP